MPKLDANVAGTLTNRSGVSRKLLARKALTTDPPISEGEGIEDSFPSDTSPANGNDENSCAAPSATVGSLLTAPVTDTPVQTSPDHSWSNADESAFQALAARRKAAGFQKRGKDVSGQMIAIGSITPNVGTVASVVVSLVEGQGEVSRADLIDAMRSAWFTNPKARPSDRGWCQGYVSGCLRDGFLRVAERALVAAVPTSEPSSNVEDPGQ